MNKIAQKIGILTWTIYFLISITGVSLQNLYCQCTGKAYTSFFSIEHECNDHHKPVKKLSPCCEKLLQQFSCHFDEGKNDDCCAPKTRIVKADIDLLISPDIELLPTISKIIAVPKLPQFTFLYSFQPKIKLQSRPPPRLHGVDLCNFIQSYLC